MDPLQFKISKLPDDAYFIQVTDADNIFIHPAGTNPANTDEVMFEGKPGTIGACVYNKKDADYFIEAVGVINLKAVQAKEVLKNNKPTHQIPKMVIAPSDDAQLIN